MHILKDISNAIIVDRRYIEVNAKIVLATFEDMNNVLRTF